jgi:drug/metabolite transporter (DMT)-like permease
MVKTSQAALWMAGWLITTLAMTLAGRELATVLPVFVVMIMRSGIALILLSPVVFLWYRGDPVRTRRLPWHIARNLVHFAGQYCWFLALALIPIAQVIAIEFTLPLWTALLAAAFLGERLTGSRIAAVVLGLLGIFLIMGPGVASFSAGQAVALAAAMLLGSAIIITKSLTRTDSPLTIIFYMFFIQTIIGLPAAIGVWQWPPQELWPWILVIGIAGTFSHFCLAKAISLADATVVVPMDFLRVPLSALAGWLLYDEGVDIWLALGSTLILAGNAVNLWRAASSQRRQLDSRQRPEQPQHQDDDQDQADNAAEPAAAIAAITPAATAEQQHQKDDDEKSRGRHVGSPS